MSIRRRSPEEVFNTVTHLLGVVFTLGVAWIILRLGYARSFNHAFGVTFFTCGMLLMFALSTLYHWWMPDNRGKARLRFFDHIGIYVMIAASYTPVCIGVVGGTLGWTVFGILWAFALGGSLFKAFVPPGRFPRLSLALYIAMGWSGVLIARPVCERLPLSGLLCILAEGIFYTGGTYFFVHDDHRYYHGLWHLAVLMGAVSHWTAILLVLVH